MVFYTNKDLSAVLLLDTFKFQHEQCIKLHVITNFSLYKVDGKRMMLLIIYKLIILLYLVTVILNTMYARNSSVIYGRNTKKFSNIEN